MCLVSEKRNPYTSDKDILCYKILIPVRDKLITPYRDFVFNKDIVVNDEAEEKIVEINKGYFIVESGYFHALTSLQKAKETLNTIHRIVRNKDFKIYKAIVPKDTPYYTGQFEDICSKSLKIIEECFD